MAMVSRCLVHAGCMTLLLGAAHCGTLAEDEEPASSPASVPYTGSPYYESSDAIPVESLAPEVYEDGYSVPYQDGYAYYYEDRWYAWLPSGWVWFRVEPPQLYEHRRAYYENVYRSMPPGYHPASSSRYLAIGQPRPPMQPPSSAAHPSVVIPSQSTNNESARNREPAPQPHVYNSESVTRPTIPISPPVRYSSPRNYVYPNHPISSGYSGHTSAPIHYSAPHSSGGYSSGSHGGSSHGSHGGHR